MVFRLVLALSLAFLAAGCAGTSPGQGGRSGESAPVMTVSDFYGFCTTLPTPGACLSDPICNKFRQELASPPEDLPACLALCRRTGQALYVDNLVNGCGETLERAEDLCDQFCRRRDRR